MALEREWVLRGLKGLLLHGFPYKVYIKKYQLSFEEARAVARSAMQFLMQGIEFCFNEEAVEQVKAIAAKFDFTDEDLTNMALEVLRGTCADPEAEESVAHHLFRNFLIKTIPQGPAITGKELYESFRPKQESGCTQKLLANLFFLDFNLTEEELREFPPEIQQLLKDISAIAKSPERP